MFILSIIFPLFSLPFLAYKFLRMRNADKRDRRRLAAGHDALDEEEHM